MNSKFKPLKTDMDSFSAIEKKLYDFSMSQGLNKEVSTAFAHSITQYVLGYLTIEGVAQSLVSSGASRQIARDLAQIIESASDKVQLESASQSSTIAKSNIH